MDGTQRVIPGMPIYIAGAGAAANTNMGCFSEAEKRTGSGPVARQVHMQGINQVMEECCKQ